MISPEKLSKQFKFVNKVPEPLRVGRRRLYDDLADKLKARPNRWAQIAIFDDCTDANSLRATLTKNYGLKIRAARQKNGQVFVYGMYQGTKSKPRTQAARTKARTVSRTKPKKRR